MSSSLPQTPFTKLYDAVYDLFDSDPTFNTLIKPGNRIRFNKDTDRDPLKHNVATEDFPEFMLTQSGGPINLMNTSSSTMLTVTFSAIITTADLRINMFANILQWMIVCNVAKWKTTLSALTWRDYNFVKVVRIADSQIGQAATERPVGIRGWNAVWPIAVECHFPTSHLVFSENEP